MKKFFTRVPLQPKGKLHKGYKELIEKLMQKQKG